MNPLQQGLKPPIPDTAQAQLCCNNESTTTRIETAKRKSGISQVHSCNNESTTTRIETRDSGQLGPPPSVAIMNPLQQGLKP